MERETFVCTAYRIEKEEQEVRSCLEDFSQTLWGKFKKILQKKRFTFLLKKSPPQKPKPKNKLKPPQHLKFTGQ